MLNGGILQKRKENENNFKIKCTGAHFIHPAYHTMSIFYKQKRLAYHIFNIKQSHLTHAKNVYILLAL
jgi:hypothetical protein